MSSHHPNARPDWTCMGCGDLWPCVTRRKELIAEFDGAAVSLDLYLADQFVQAAVDLPHRPAGRLYQQFLGWPRHARTVPVQGRR